MMCIRQDLNVIIPKANRNNKWAYTYPVYILDYTTVYTLDYATMYTLDYTTVYTLDYSTVYTLNYTTMYILDSVLCIPLPWTTPHCKPWTIPICVPWTTTLTTSESVQESWHRHQFKNCRILSSGDQQHCVNSFGKGLKANRRLTKGP